VPITKLTRRQEALVLAIRTVSGLLGQKKVPAPIVFELSRRFISEHSPPHRVLQAIEEFDQGLLSSNHDSSVYWSNRAPNKTEVLLNSPEPNFLTSEQLIKIIKRCLGEETEIHPLVEPKPKPPKLPFVIWQKPPEKVKPAPITLNRERNGTLADYFERKKQILTEILKREQIGDPVPLEKVGEICKRIEPGTPPLRIIQAIKRRGWLDIDSGRRCRVSNLGKAIISARS
jgi:hypothetical protein